MLFDFKFGKLFNNKIKQYSFKILQRILPFKENLVKWRIMSDMICKKCNEVESIWHVLLHCPDTKLYWEKISNFICAYFHIDITVNERMILTGIDVRDKSLMLLNLILVLAQYTIFRLYILSNYTAKATNVYALLINFRTELNMNLKFLIKKTYLISRKGNFMN